jgi:hypothetical protein
MSKMTTAVKKERSEQLQQKEMRAKKAVKNYMGGTSYEVNPLLTLKMITASSIFGEPQYYRDGQFGERKVVDGLFSFSPIFAPYALFDSSYDKKKTSTIMEEAIDESLDFDFMGTLKWAQTLRHEYNMRLNPQVIMVRAAAHPKRAEFTTANPGVFDTISQKVMARGDEPASQLTYHLFKNKSVKGIPNILKKAWAKRIASMSRYELAKYKNKGSWSH